MYLPFLPCSGTGLTVSFRVIELLTVVTQQKNVRANKNFVNLTSEVQVVMVYSVCLRFRLLI